jgi:hypothetical protein
MIERSWTTLPKKRGAQILSNPGRYFKRSDRSQKQEARMDLLENLQFIGLTFPTNMDLPQHHDPKNEEQSRDLSTDTPTGVEIPILVQVDENDKGRKGAFLGL